MASNLIEKIKLESIYWLARRLPVCRELTPWMSERLDHPLPLGREIKLRLHLMICEWCKRYQEQLVVLRDAVQTLSDSKQESIMIDQPGLSSEARKRIKNAMNEQDR